MPQTVKQNRPAEMPEAKPLTLNVTIPPRAVPLFNALVAVTRAPSPEAFAEWAILKGLTCEESMGKFDDLVNGLLAG